MPGPLLAHDRQDSASDVFLGEPGGEVSGVVDQGVDPAEAVYGRLGGARVRDVQGGGQQVVLLAAQHLSDALRTAAGGHDLVTGGKDLAGDVRAQPASGAGDEKDLAHDGGVLQADDECGTEERAR